MPGTEGKLRALEAANEARRLSREELIRPRSLIETVTIEGLGGSVVLKSLSERVRREIAQKAGEGTPHYDDRLFTRLVIVASLMDPKLEPDDVEALQDQDGAVIDELALHVTSLNMMGKAPELKKDSGPTQTSGSDLSLQNDSE